MRKRLRREELRLFPSQLNLISAATRRLRAAAEGRPTFQTRGAMDAIHPGEHLAEELRELNMSAAKFAAALDVPTNRITQIIKGQRAITGDTALRLAHFFGTSEQFWMNLQSLYELRLAERKARKAIDRLPTMKALLHA